MINVKKCSKCLTCYGFCPENAIKPNGEGVPVINLQYCKGCGICAKECPLRAISMKFEEEMKHAEENGADR